MRQDHHQLLKPEIINSLSGLALIARVVVEGFLQGANRSRRVGSGMEFSQYRGYEPGDDLRLLDWKMLARSGRYYIKQSEVDTNIEVKFILDASNSMQHGEMGMSKMDLARVLIASLAYLAMNQGDSVGLYAVNDRKLHSLFPKGSKQHYNRLLHELLQIKSGGKWPNDAQSTKKLHERGKKELIFFLTDMYEQGTELNAFIKRLKTPRNEVVVFHIMGNLEMDFDHKGTVTFEDLETGARVKVETKEAKKQYLEALESFLNGVKEQLLVLGAGYHLVKMGSHIPEALQVFLRQRNVLTR
ncbi:MAG: DUF58 domain-containing protein [Sediminicola sp.]